MRALAPLVLGATITLAACGSGSTTAPATTTDSGSPAAWIGTKGVQLNVRNMSDTPIYIGTRGNGDIRELKPNETRTFRGERSGADDVELLVRWSSSGDDGVDIDASNPAMAEPNVSVNGVLQFFSVAQHMSWKLPVNGVETGIGVRRDSDTSEFKRFDVVICRDKRAVHTWVWGCS